MSINQESHTPIEGVFFDGHKDKTFTKVLGIDNKYHRKTVMEEHKSINAEPGSSSFSHTILPSGSRKNIAESLVTSLKQRNVKMENIKVLGCDGTN